MTYTIYVIRHPGTREPVYVGRTSKSLQIRLRGHLSTCRSANSYLSDAHRLKGWIRSLPEDPIIEALVSEVPEHMSVKLEMTALEAFRSDGWDMLNMIDW